MKPEPLRGKIYHKVDDQDLFRWEDVEAAVEFFRKYVDNRNQFQTDFKNTDWSKYVKNSILTTEQLDVIFNAWLLEYCFQDVSE